ncbi:MAG: hypothetical protein ABEI99_03095, partial [Halobaculum sp.]
MESDEMGGPDRHGGPTVRRAEIGDGVETMTVERGAEIETHDVDAVVVAAMPNVLEDLTGYA